jgi:Fe-S-cluster containining protein
MKYECDKCGACCDGYLLVQAEWLDMVREPRLKDADPYHRDRSVDEVLELLRDEMRVVTLSCGKPCPFLGDDKSCSIYPTRPNDCVGMEAGDEQCQDSRKAAGLPPLEPMEER